MTPAPHWPLTWMSCRGGVGVRALLGPPRHSAHFVFVVVVVALRCVVLCSAVLCCVVLCCVVLCCVVLCCVVLCCVVLCCVVLCCAVLCACVWHGTGGGVVMTDGAGTRPHHFARSPAMAACARLSRRVVRGSAGETAPSTATRGLANLGNSGLGSGPVVSHQLCVPGCRFVVCIMHVPRPTAVSGRGGSGGALWGRSCCSVRRWPCVVWTA